MDSLEQELRRRLITVRELNQSAVESAENQLYEYQIKIGSVAAHFAYEKGELRG